MNEAPQDLWFYTREGERAGPVGFAELKAKAAAAALDPRLDMVWRQGMEDWKPAGEIEELFEKRVAPEPQDVIAPQEPAAESVGIAETWPGARRRSYLFAVFFLPVLLSIGVPAVTAVFKSRIDPQMSGAISLGAGILLCVIVIHISLQRLVNLGMSRWWYLGNFVPLLNLWVGFRCFACPSGYAFHKKLDGPGVALAILYWLMLALALVAVIGVIAVILGAANNPELQKALEGPLRAIREGAPKP